MIKLIIISTLIALVAYLIYSPLYPIIKSTISNWRKAGDDYEYKEFDFNPLQRSILKSLNISPNDLSMLTSMLSMGPMFASECVDDIQRAIDGLFRETESRQALACLYRNQQYRGYIDLALKVIGEGYGPMARGWFGELGRLKQDGSGCKGGLGEELKVLMNNKGLRAAFDKHFTTISLARTILPESVISLLESVINTVNHRL